VYEGLWMDIGTPERLKEINTLYDTSIRANLEESE